MARPASRSRPLPSPAEIELPAVFHPVLAAKLECAKRSREQEGKKLLPDRAWGPFGTVLGRRILRIQDAILKTAEACGHAVCHPKDSYSPLWLNIVGERVDWEFRERNFLRKVPIENGERAYYPPAKTWKQISLPSGFLVLSIKTDYATKKHVHEKPGKYFESRIREILDRFEAKAAHAKAQRDNWAERERQRWEREARQRRQHTLEEREHERWSELRQLTAEWKEAESLRAFVSVVSKRMNELEIRPARLDLWLDWANRRIDALDPLLQTAQDLYETVVQRPYPDRYGETDMPDLDDP